MDKAIFLDEILHAYLKDFASEHRVSLRALAGSIIVGFLKDTSPEGLDRKFKLLMSIKKPKMYTYMDPNHKNATGHTLLEIEEAHTKFKLGIGEDPAKLFGSNYFYSMLNDFGVKKTISDKKAKEYGWMPDEEDSSNR